MNDNSDGIIKTIPPFLYVVIVLGLIFFLYQVIGGALAIAAGAEKLEGNVQTIRIILAFSQFMFILAPTVLFARLQTREVRKMLRIKLPNPIILLLSILGVFVVQPLLQGYLYFQDFILSNLPVLKDFLRQFKELFDALDAATLKIVRAYSIVEFSIVLFVICLTPSLCEELLFRGFVLSNFEKIAKPGAAVFLSGFMFAIYHFQPINTIPLIVLGVYLGFVVQCSGSILTGMTCHFLNNFFSAYLLFAYGKEELETPGISSSEMLNYGFVSVVSLILFTVLLIIIHRIYRRSTRTEDSS